jgi:hypothetical protein
MAMIYAQKMNAIFLARLVDNNPFHLYLNKPICLIPGFDGASLSSESKDTLWARFFMKAPTTTEAVRRAVQHS